MYVLGSVLSPVTEMQVTLRDLGYLKTSDVDGLFGKVTMTAVIKLGLDSITDFAASLNAGGADADKQQIGVSAMRGIQTKLQSAIGSDGRYAGTTAAFDAVKNAQSRLKEQWAAWVRAGGRGATDRAAKFTSMVISKSGGSGGGRASTTTPTTLPSTLPDTESSMLPSGFSFSSPTVIIAAGVGVAAILLLVAMSGSKKSSPATA